MAILRIASKANQAASLPALLVISHVNQIIPNANIDIKFEEVEALEDGTTLQLDMASESSLRGSEKIIESLLQKYPALSGSSEKQVDPPQLRINIDTT